MIHQIERETRVHPGEQPGQRRGDADTHPKSQPGTNGTDHHAQHDEATHHRGRARPQCLEDRYIRAALLHHHDQRRYEVEGSDAYQEREQDEHRGLLHANRLVEIAVRAHPAARKHSIQAQQREAFTGSLRRHKQIVQLQLIAVDLRAQTK